MTRKPNVGATPAVITGSLRASPIPVPSMEIPSPITRLVFHPERMAAATEEGSQTPHESVYADPVVVVWIACRPRLAHLHDGAFQGSWTTSHVYRTLDHFLVDD